MHLKEIRRPIGLLKAFRVDPANQLIVGQEGGGIVNTQAFSL